MEFSLFEFLANPKGLAILHILQTLMFSMMLYILAADYYRSARADLVYKLLAATSITLINILSALIYYLEGFHKLNRLSLDGYFPLLFNSIFVIVVLLLAKAFIYDFITNKKRFDVIFRSTIVFIFMAYMVIQFFWLIFRTGPFSESAFQFAFSIYFIIILLFIIFMNIRYRKKYRMRLALAFASIIVAQLINAYGYLIEPPGDALKITRSLVTIMIPLMFGSVTFKELIERNDLMTGDLKKVFTSQNTLINELGTMSEDLGRLSGNIFDKSGESWMRLTDIKVIVDGINQARENKNLAEIIRTHSRDIEAMAGLTESLNGVIERVQNKTELLHAMAEKISYINESD